METKDTKYHPILFSTPMVQAIQEGRKYQTRRTKGLESINENPDAWKHEGIAAFGNIALEKNDFRIYHCFEEKSTGKRELVKCPYELDDVLWVRENFYTFSNWDHWKPSMLKSVNVEVFYSADLQNDYISKPLHRGKTRPNIFLPAAYCRIFLKIQSIRVHRLKEITHWDSIAEGVAVRLIDGDEEYKDYLAEGVSEDEPWGETYFPNNPKPSFLSLWESINGTESLDKNPFVWVYQFQQIEKPLDFIP